MMKERLLHQRERSSIKVLSLRFRSSSSFSLKRILISMNSKRSRDKNVITYYEQQLIYERRYYDDMSFSA